MGARPRRAKSSRSARHCFVMEAIEPGPLAHGRISFPRRCLGPRVEGMTSTTSLAEFICQNIEPILAAWDERARDILQARQRDPAAARDHAEGGLQPRRGGGGIQHPSHQRLAALAGAGPGTGGNGRATEFGNAAGYRRRRVDPLQRSHRPGTGRVDGALLGREGTAESPVRYAADVVAGPQFHLWPRWPVSLCQ